MTVTRLCESLRIASRLSITFGWPKVMRKATTDSHPGRWAGHRVTVMLAVAAVLLAACGGSSHKKTVAATSAPISLSTPVTTTLSSSTAPKKDPPHLAKASASAASTKKSAATYNAANPTAVNPSNTHPTAAGPKPLACLTGAGLNRARAGKEPGVWEANAGLSAAGNTDATVFVDGPYKSTEAADAAVASLKPVEIAARGGLYEVSATLPSHLTSQVNAVAHCLGGSASGSKSKKYSF